MALQCRSEVDFMRSWRSTSDAAASARAYKEGAGARSNGRPKVVNQPQAYRVRIALGRSDVMKILSRSGSRNVRQRDVGEQRGRGGADQRSIDCVRNTVELILLSCLGIEDLNGFAVIVGRPS